jgi:uncharacterized cupin superfamily protein
MSPALIRFDAPPATEPAIDHPRAERREAGNPERRTWTIYESADDGVYAGFWDCEPGRWRIERGASEHEYFHVIHGRARLVDEAGAMQEFGPGQAAVIPAGFKGSFEVVEPKRKHFVIVER